MGISVDRLCCSESMFGFLDLKDMLKILNGQSRFSFLTLMIITSSKLPKQHKHNLG